MSHPDYADLSHSIAVASESIELELRLESMPIEDRITVIGIRAAENVPVTKRNLDREEIEVASYGQDVPAPKFRYVVRTAPLPSRELQVPDFPIPAQAGYSCHCDLGILFFSGCQCGGD